MKKFIMVTLMTASSAIFAGNASAATWVKAEAKGEGRSGAFAAASGKAATSCKNKGYPFINRLRNRKTYVVSSRQNIWYYRAEFRCVK